MLHHALDRREALRRIAALGVGVLLPPSFAACRGDSPSEERPASEIALAEPAEQGRPAPLEDEERLHSWISTLSREGLTSSDVPLGVAAIRVGELAIGTPYEPYTLEAYIRAGDSPARTEPLTLSLTRFDCVSLVESCLAVARVGRSQSPPTWEAFALAMERMRYRGGTRGGYSTRLHYFSEWLRDNERRGLVRSMGEELGGVPDRRPLRFMSSHSDAYPALAYPDVLAEIGAMEKRLDADDRWVVATASIAGIGDRLQTGDILAFGTSIDGLDVTHAAFAYRSESGPLRVLHAPLSGGVVEVTKSTIPEYVTAINRSTGILVGRPLDG